MKIHVGISLKTSPSIPLSIFSQKIYPSILRISTWIVSDFHSGISPELFPRNYFENFLKVFFSGIFTGVYPFVYSDILPGIPLKIRPHIPARIPTENHLGILLDIFSLN